MEIVFSILTLIGMAYAVYCGLRWMMRSGVVNARKEQSLTPNDLKILEESAARLMADLRNVTDECVAKINRACSEAEIHIQTLEKSPVSCSQLYEMIELDEQPASVLAYAGMSKGEIQLLQGLKSIGN